jgi:WD40 repeat protein
MDGDNVTAAAWSPDGKKLALGADGGLVRIFGGQGQGAPTVLSGHTDQVHSLSWSPDGKWLVTASEDMTSRMWSAEGLGICWQLSGHREAVYSAEWSPDGGSIVTASGDGTARVWDARRKALDTPVQDKGGTAKEGFLFCNEVEEPVAIELLSPDGKKRLVTRAGEKDAYVYDIAAGKQGTPVVLSGHRNPIYCAGWSPDSQRIVTGSSDWDARIWNSDGSGSCLVLEGHTNFVVLACFSPDGRKVLTMALDGTTRIWGEGGRSDVLLNKELDRSVGIRRDWKKLITQNEDKVRLIWDLELDPSVLLARLWRATPFCLSAAERERHLRESPDQAARNQADALSRAAKT